jgi:hypothetical protein
MKKKMKFGDGNERKHQKSFNPYFTATTNKIKIQHLIQQVVLGVRKKNTQNKKQNRDKFVPILPHSIKLFYLMCGEKHIQKKTFKQTLNKFML